MEKSKQENINQIIIKYKKDNNTNDNKIDYLVTNLFILILIIVN